MNSKSGGRSIIENLKKSNLNQPSSNQNKETASLVSVMIEQREEELDMLRQLMIMQSDTYNHQQEIPTENYLKTTVSSMLKQNKRIVESMEKRQTQMQNSLEQAGKNQEQIMKDFLSKVQIYAKSMEDSAEKEALKIRIGRMIIAVISGAISSVISTLLCIHFLV